MTDSLSRQKQRKLPRWTLACVVAGWPALCMTMAVAQGTPTLPNAHIRAAMAWAFPLSPPPGPDAPPPDMHKPQHVPGSTRMYTLAQYDNMFGAPDWWPQDHPPMPPIVARGHQPAWACLPHTRGGPLVRRTHTDAGSLGGFLGTQIFVNDALNQQGSTKR